MPLSLASAFPVDATLWLTSTSTTFVLVFLAELGDKTQLVCMTLAARHRGRPVFLGAAIAFLLLNLLAVLFGATLAHWLPEKLLAAIVAVLFAVFGLQSLRTASNGENEEIVEKSGHSLFLTTFLMIFVAELGDKTQIAVAGMAGTYAAGPVWLGGTLALVLSAALAVMIGRKLLQKIPMNLLHRLVGIFFLLLAGLALTKVF